MELLRLLKMLKMLEARMTLLWDQDRGAEPDIGFLQKATMMRIPLGMENLYLRLIVIVLG